MGHHTKDVKLCVNSMTVFTCRPSAVCAETREQLLVFLPSLASPFQTHAWAPGSSSSTVRRAAGNIWCGKVPTQIILIFLFPGETCDENTAEILSCNPF